MNRDKDKATEFDRAMRKKFGAFTPKVPEGLWDKIAEQLDTPDQIPVVPVGGQKRRFSTWWMAVAATILIVFGLTYWYNRPVSVIYLQGRTMVDVPLPEKPEVASVVEQEQRPEPLDMERLKRLFAKKERATAVATRDTPNAEPILREAAAAEEPKIDVRATEQLAIAAPDDPLVHHTTAREEVAMAKIPEIEPPIVLEEADETLLAASAKEKQPFGLSNILNYVVSTVDSREEKLVTFSNDAEGSLKWDFNFGLAKNKKKKVN